MSASVSALMEGVKQKEETWKTNRIQVWASSFEGGRRWKEEGQTSGQKALFDEDFLGFILGVCGSLLMAARVLAAGCVWTAGAAPLSAGARPGNGAATAHSDHIQRRRDVRPF